MHEWFRCNIETIRHCFLYLENTFTHLFRFLFSGYQHYE